MTRVVVNSCGWLGVILIVGAYGLNVGGMLQAQDTLYLLMNIGGSAGIIINSYYKKDIQPVVLNIFWLIIALVGIIISLYG
jgi:hypothetical protein